MSLLAKALTDSDHEAGTLYNAMLARARVRPLLTDPDLRRAVEEEVDAARRPAHRSGSSSYVDLSRYRRLEKAASEVLGQYASKHGPLEQPPVPIRALADELGLECVVAELNQRKRGVKTPRVDSVLLLDENKIVIDDEYVNRGRYNFSLAHELGHWIFCRKSPQRYSKRKIVCRSSLETIDETEANIFASILLVPTDLVGRAIANVDVLDLNRLWSLANDFQVSGIVMYRRVRFLSEIVRELPVTVSYDVLRRFDMGEYA